jgi:hypothetical protein
MRLRGTSTSLPQSQLRRAHASGPVEEGDALARHAVFLGPFGKPGRTSEGVVEARRSAIPRVPERAFPAEALTKAGAARGSPLVHRRATEIATGREFVAGPGDRVVVTENLRDATSQERGVVHRRTEPAGIDFPKVERRLAFPDPLGDRPAGTAGARDAEGVEAGRDEETVAPRDWAEEEGAVRGETLRAVDEAIERRRSDRRQAVLHLSDRGVEPLPIGIEELEGKVVRHAFGRQRLGVVLEGAEADAVADEAEVDGAVVVARTGEIVGDAGDRRGFDVVVLDRVERDVEAVVQAELPRPHAAAEEDVFRGDVACGGGDAGGAAAVPGQAEDVDTLSQRCAVQFGAFGERPRRFRRFDAAIVRQEEGAGEVVGAQTGPELCRVGGWDLVAVDPEQLDEGGGAADLGDAIGRARKKQTPDLLPTGVVAGFAG